MTRKQPQRSPSLLHPLPQRFDVWQVNALQIEASFENCDYMVQPWVLIAVSETDGRIIAFEVCKMPPTSSDPWQFLQKAMTSPAKGDPHRPTEIQIPDDDWLSSLEDKLEEIGVKCVVVKSLTVVDQLFEDLVEQMATKEEGLLDVPDVTPAIIGGFFDAAAFYFRQAPWKRHGEKTIKIECSNVENGTWYAVMLGQGGMTSGLVLYDDLDAMNRLKTGEMTEEEDARQTSALAMMFGEEEDLSEADLLALREYDWELAGDFAYPTVYRKIGMTMRPPLAWELELLEGCLRLVPEFIKSRKKKPFEKTVSVASGDLDFVLSRV